MGKPKVGMTVPVALDEVLLAEVERVANQRGEAKSTTMRAALRAGLPIVENGAPGDSLPLDGELSSDVEQVAREFKLSRSRVLADSVKIGLPALFARLQRKESLALNKGDADAAAEFFEHLLAHDLEANPSRREAGEALRLAKRQTNILCDLFAQTRETKDRWNNMVYLAALRSRPAHVAKTGLFNGGGLPFGVPDEDIRKQIAQHEAELTPEERKSFSRHLDLEEVVAHGDGIKPLPPASQKLPTKRSNP
jgi:predicted transcriptional regulator